MEQKITVSKFFKHLKTILIHKYWVFYFSCKLGIPWRGLVHDLSKFSPVEFWESVRYFDGKVSPIVICKRHKGYSLAWQHHKGHNSHHYEYWVDRLDGGGVPLQMPWKDVLELVADYCGAGKAYQGKNFTLKDEYEWWLEKKETGIKMNEATMYEVTGLLHALAYNSKGDLRKYLRDRKLRNTIGK